MFYNMTRVREHQLKEPMYPSNDEISNSLLIY